MTIKKILQRTTLDIPSSALHKNYVARICGDGKILPIEERIGKKLIKTINPVSRKGKKLLAQQKVTFHLPDGDRLSPTSLSQVFLKLRESTLEKMKKFPEDEYQEAHTNQVIEHINEWEKLYLDE